MASGRRMSISVLLPRKERGREAAHCLSSRSLGSRGQGRRAVNEPQAWFTLDASRIALWDSLLTGFLGES